MSKKSYQHSRQIISAIYYSIKQEAEKAHQRKRHFQQLGC